MPQQYSSQPETKMTNFNILFFTLIKEIQNYNQLIKFLKILCNFIQQTLIVYIIFTIPINLIRNLYVRDIFVFYKHNNFKQYQ